MSHTCEVKSNCSELEPIPVPPMADLSEMDMDPFWFLDNPQTLDPNRPDQMSLIMSAMMFALKTLKERVEKLEE